MAREIQNSIRLHRKGVGGIALVLSVVALSGWFVLPGVAGGSAPVPIPPTSKTVGVTPQFLNVGGSFSCGSVNSTATGSLLINNPKKNAKVTVPGTNYSITLDATTTSTITGWTATGGIRVVDVAVKGGEKTAWYRYRTPRVFYTGKYASLFNGLGSDDGVVRDTWIHAPMKYDDDEDEKDLYSLSQMTFCYVIPNATVSGTVQRQGTSAAPAGSWSVQAYDATTSAALGSAVPVAGDGSYSVSVPPSTSVKLCVKTTSTVAWTQVDPSSGATTCSGSGQLPWGKTITSGAATTDTPGQGFVVTPTSADIKGRVFQDAYPYDGQWAAGDSGLSGWTVTATSSFNGATVSAQTAGDGQYTISVPNGDGYTVCVTATPDPAGNWAPTAPTPPGTGCTTTGAGSTSIQSGSRSIAALAAAPAGSSGNDYAFKRPNVTISGAFWNDVDVNGAYDSSIDNKPTKADNWTITVKDANGNTFTPSLTGAGGSAAASYSVAVPGFQTYTVCAAPTVGNALAPWKQSKPTGTPDPLKCGTAGAKLPVGYTLALQGSASGGNDFAGLEATAYTCGSTPPAGEQAFSVSCGDKWGSPSASVFWLYSQWTGDDGKQNVLLDSQTPPQNAGTKVAYLEKITWTYSGNAQNALTMYFIDKSPWSPAYVSGAIAMRDCNYDPRGPNNQTSLAPIAPAANVIPSYAGDVPPGGYAVGDYTSCILYKVVQRPVTPGGSGTYTFYVYSEGDAYRSGY